MANFKGPSPKPRIMFSNDKEFVQALCTIAGYLPRFEAQSCPVKTTKKYIDKQGVKRCTGVKKALRDSQSLA